MPDGPWICNITELIQNSAYGKNGLSSLEAKNRLLKYGPNTIPDKDKKVWLDLLLSQFSNQLVLILIFASIVSAYLGDIFDTIIILIIVIISALLGFFQEYKSEKVLSELKKYFSYHAVVIRNGEKIQVDTRELVPGDIVFVGIGDIVPADLRIIETTGIFVDESTLTGESREVEKSVFPPASPNTPQEINNGLFMGTTILDGYAKALVVTTGSETFFGKTAAVFSSKVPESDFQLGIRKFGDTLIKIVVIISIIVFISNYVMGHGDKNPLIESALFALAISVGIAPEALPAIITVTLSNGSMALAKRKVITKKLAAIEDLGNMDILCTDKTGTLTDEMQVERYIDLDRNDSHDVLKYAILCNSAVGAVKIRGNSVDVAIKKHGKAQQVDVSRFKKIQEIPFDFVRKRMGQVVKEGKHFYLIIKGAPENVLEQCTKIKISGKEYPHKIKAGHVRDMIAEYCSQGYSAIGVAYKDIPDKGIYSKTDEFGLIFIGFILIKNHAKQSVRPTLDRLKKLNVNLKVLTGDDALVTKKLCQDVGLNIVEGKVILGSEIKQMDAVLFSRVIEKYNVFARVTPEQKLAIIETLRKNNHVVGFLGDGINDAPSLRTADVGISVDTAADVAKGASHIILLRKGIDVICDGIEGGRKIFGNINKYILNTMSSNQGNMITISLSSFFLPFIPLLPGQILLNNLLSDVPLMSISSDNVDSEYLERPRKWDISFIVKFMLFFGLISTLFDFAFILVLHFIVITDVDSFRTAWFLESVLSEMFIVFSLRTHLPFFKNLPSWMLVFTSVCAAVVSIFAIYFEPIATVFHFVPIGLPLLLFTGAVLLAYFVAVELGKVFFYSRFARIK